MEPDDNEIRCQIMWQLKQDKKYDEIADHVLTCCLDCITNPRKQFGGREMLFPDAPPPWIKMPESEKSDPQAWRKYQKRQVHQQMTPEEFDDFLIESDFGDERMCHEIAKFKRIERVEAWIVLRELRKKQRERRLEAEKIAREIKKRETDEKREAEKLKKMDEKLKIQEKKQQKDDEKQEYLDKIHELEEVLGVAAEPKEGRFWITLGAMCDAGKTDQSAGNVEFR